MQSELIAPRQQIRVIALGLIRHKQRLFVSEGYDEVKQQFFYRALGGGVEFGESSLDALQREFREEIQAELTNIRYLGCLENLFVFNGKPGHEIVQIYGCDFVDEAFYQQEQFSFVEPEDPQGQIQIARWVEVQQFHTGALRLVPEACLQYLNAQG
ncbi:MAG TPA: NUDIX hydrolase [Leptolyngbyaceae cyanobacterium M33_DOE_097]|nr:NUDIX hydrolase [Leptolyngbyaceae cyanobacterium M33_DOE_097]